MADSVPLRDQAEHLTLMFTKARLGRKISPSI